MKKRSYIRPSHGRVFVVQEDFRLLARNYHRGYRFDPRRTLLRWRRIMMLYRREMICTPAEWYLENGEWPEWYTPNTVDLDKVGKAESQPQPQPEFKPEPEPQPKKKESFDREKAEETYRSLGGRVHDDWTDNELKERIKKKRKNKK